MLSEYIWKIEKLESASDTVVGKDYVVVVHWAVQGTHNGIFAKIPGKTKFDINANQSNFIPYTELTEETILNWVWTHVNKQTIESHLDIKINDLLTPKIKMLPLPWAS
jgi:hypothetical protein